MIVGKEQRSAVERMREEAKIYVTGHRGLEGLALLCRLAASGSRLFTRTHQDLDLANSHVLLTLVRKMHEAKISAASEVEGWGTGSPRREFLHGDDLADTSAFLMGLLDEKYDALLTYPTAPALINIGSGIDLSIHELAMIVRDVVGYGGKLVFDASRPDGMPRKWLDVSHMQALGWQASFDLRMGIASTYADFLRRQERPS